MVNKKVTSATSSPPAAPQRKATAAPRDERPAPKPKAATPVSAPPNAISVRLANVQRVYRETAAELRKVQWPDRTTTRNLTLVVIGMSAALAVLLGGVDAILTRLIEWLVGLG